MGIEPTSTAWEAVVLPMNYIRIFRECTLTNFSEKVKRLMPNIPGVPLIFLEVFPRV